jgi:hypothetical protein
MAKDLFTTSILTAATGLWTLCASLGQEPPPPPGTGPQPPSAVQPPQAPPKPPLPEGGQGHPGRHAWSPGPARDKDNKDRSNERWMEKLPPEQREQFRNNLEKWQNMAPEMREEVRRQEEQRRDRINKEVGDILKRTGLQLDRDRREVFALRYTQERRKIEEQLRKEMEERRKPMLEDLVGRLKAEFSVALPSPSPADSPAR